MSQAYEKNMYSQARKNVLRTWIIVSVFSAVVIIVGYVCALYFDNLSIVVAATIGAFASNVSSYFFSQKIAITAGIPTPGVYVIDDPAMNAFATGRNPKNASVAFTTGILKVLDKNELEGVVAHELSHIKNRDILVGTIVVIMVGFVALVADMFMRTGLNGRSRSSEGGPAAGVIILVGIIFALLAPLVGRLIQFAVTRKREYLADASGALLTRYPEGLASALVKINNNGQPMRKTSQATSHLFISNPFGKKGSVGSTIANLFSTHPPMEKRVEALLGEDMKNELLGVDPREKELKEK